MENVSVLKLNLFKNSEKSFLVALDAEGIKHSRMEMFANQFQASGIVEVISALSEAMPWNAIAKVMIEWIKARKSRRVFVTMKGQESIDAKGYSAKELEKILPKAINATIIDTQSEE